MRFASSHVILLAVLTVLPSGVRAGGDEEDALVTAGNELRRKGRDAEALEQFRKAVALRRSPRSLAQAGLAAQAVGLWLEAEASLTEALDAADDPWIGKWREVLDESLRAVRKHLATLVVETHVPGAELWIDEQRVEELNPNGNRVRA